MMPKPIPEFIFTGQSLSKENSELYIKLLLYGREKEAPLGESSIATDSISQIFLKRIKGYKLKFTVTDLFFGFCVELFVDSPGILMILLRLCYQYWRNTGQELIGVEDFAYIFPCGTPNKDELKEMWESQKYRDHPALSSDNLLDYPELWPSD